jgi:head-tail adaptor
VTAGARNSFIVFSRATAGQDEYGEEVSTWSDLGKEWAKVHYGRGDERRQAAMEQGQLPATFVVLDNPMARSVTLKDRITFDEGDWDISANTPGKPGEREITATRAT